MNNDPIPTAEAIIKSLVEAGIPQSVVAKKLAIAPSAVSMLFKGLRGLKLSEANILLSLIPNRRQVRSLPLIALAGAGRWVEAIEEASRTVTIPPEIDAGGDFAVEVVGDSMNLLMAEGSFAIVDPKDTRLFAGKLYLLINGEGEGTIKRYRTEPSRFEPVSDNPEYQPFEVGSFDFKVVGRVTAAMQTF
jgi:SOS-response transcriptional repressor LexA